MSAAGSRSSSLPPPEQVDLDDPARLAALADTGLRASPDAPLDRFAAMVSKMLDVPVALVSLVDDGRQFFPGASGLGPPWLATRQTPLTHSFCQRVVISGRPLVITDARADAQMCTNLAIPDLGVIAYAGMPLTDEDGLVLGSLCAIADQPREWTTADLDLLADLAAACTAELRLRITARRAVSALTAQRAAQDQIEQLSAEVSTALDRSQLLLAASEALTGTTTVPDVVAVVADLVSGGLAPTHVGVMLLDDQRNRLDLIASGPLPPDAAELWTRTALGADEPSAIALREQRMLTFANRNAFSERFPELAEDLARIGWSALACAPLIGATGPVGTLRFAWAQPHPIDLGERAVIVALAGYVSAALERARRLRERVTAAETLQRALLTDLPPAAGYQLAARYQPANSGDEIGGDWYDAVELPGGRLALVIGDVVGHDMAAAARMGQLRSMLRGYLIDRDEAPDALIRRLDAANHALGDHTLATLLVAVLKPLPGPEGAHLLHWSCAGQPPPVLLLPDGTAETLSGRGVMLGARWNRNRETHTRRLPRGATLLLHTDGLIEVRGEDLVISLERLRAFLAEQAGQPLDALLDATLTQIAGPYPEDDIALLAVRLPNHS